MKSKKIKKILTLAMLLPLMSCNSSTSTSEYAKDTDENYYQAINERCAFDESNSNNFDEDFSNGISSKIFSSVDGVWDAGSTLKHNGVRSRNLFYTYDDEGCPLLAIKGRGRYNIEDESTKNLPEGAVLITNDHLGPGRYEIEMRAFPRYGGCTAFWTYCTTTGNEATSQNEIDIEIGGEGQFTNQWCTSWTTHTNKETKNIDLSSLLHFNDGQMHKYTFDWYTDYENTGEKRIDWFVDEHFVTSITGSSVSEHEMQLWLGLWLPSWAGDSKFDYDYLLIKNISYTAFDADQYYETCRSKTSFSLTSPDDLDIEMVDYDKIKNVNKLSNGDFSISEKYSTNDYYGWNIEKASSGTMSFVEEENISSVKLTAGNDTGTQYHGEYIYQDIGGAYDNYKYTLTIDAKKGSETSSGNIEITYKTIAGSIISSEIISVDSTSYKTYEKNIIMPEGSEKLTITLTSEDGSIYYSNAKLVYTGLN